MYIDLLFNFTVIDVSMRNYLHNNFKSTDNSKLHENIEYIVYKHN